MCCCYIYHHNLSILRCWAPSKTWLTDFICMRLWPEEVGDQPPVVLNTQVLEDEMITPVMWHLCPGEEHGPSSGLILTVCVFPTGRRWISHPQILHTAENRLHWEEILLWRRSSRQVSRNKYCWIWISYLSHLVRTFWFFTPSFPSPFLHLK